MPIRDLNLGVWFYIFEYLTFEDLRNFGFASKLAHVLFARQKCCLQTASHFEPKFLPLGATRDQVALVSYPRCGNSFLRRLLEARTQITTGSDSAPMRSLSAELLRCGYLGEGVTDKSVWIVKSHYPERVGFVRFRANRVIVLIRNPFDALLSYFHMGMTNTHNRSLSKEVFRSLASVWDAFVASEINVWVRFYEYWLQQGATAPLGTIQFVRFEDLIINEEGSVGDIISFLVSGDRLPLGFKYCADRTIRRQSDDTVQATPLPGYKRRGQTKFGEAMAHFSGDQIEAVAERGRKVFQAYGYVVENSTVESTSEGVGEGFKRLTSPKSVLKVLPLESVAVLRAIDSKLSKCADSSSPDHIFLFNVPPDVRQDDVQFGRKFTELRKSVTDNDRSPLDLKPLS